MWRNLTETISTATSIPPAVLTADTDGAGVDLRGYESAAAVVHVGVSGDTLSGSVYIDLALEESDDNSTFAPVAAGDLTGAFTTIDDPAEDDVVQVVGYDGTARYLRIAVDVTGTHTNGTPIGATIVRGHAKVEPAS